MNLRTYIDRDPAKLIALARALSVSEVTVYRWAAGTRMPRRENVRAIERATGGAVTPGDFYAQHDEVAA